jgi:hypothetical protein
MSKDGMIELAGRVYWIFPLVIAAVIVAWKYGYLTGRAAPTDSSSNDPLKKIGELQQQIEQMRVEQGQLKMRVQEQPEQQLLEQRIELLERLLPLIGQHKQLEKQLEQRIKQQEQQLK